MPAPAASPPTPPRPRWLDTVRLQWRLRHDMPGVMTFLARNIGKGNAGLALRVDFGIGFANVHGAHTAAAHALAHPAEQQLAN